MNTSRNNPYVLPLEEGGAWSTECLHCACLSLDATWCPGSLRAIVTERESKMCYALSSENSEPWSSIIDSSSNQGWDRRGRCTNQCSCSCKRQRSHTNKEALEIAIRKVLPLQTQGPEFESRKLSTTMQTLITPRCLRG